MKCRESERTLVTLANASEVSVAVTQQIMGNEIADTFNGSPLSRELIQNLAQSVFQGAIQSKVGV